MSGSPPPLRRHLARCCTLALLVLIATAPAGCKKERAGKGSGKSAPSAEAEPSGPLDKLVAPKDVFLFGGVDNPMSLIDSLGKLAGAFNPAAAAMTAGLWAALPRKLRLSKPDALDASKPLRVVVADGMPKPDVTLIVGTKGQEKLIAALPPGHEKNKQGNAFAARGMFYNFIGDHVVVTRSPTSFGARKDFLRRLVGSVVKGGARLVIPVQHVRARLEPALAAMSARAAQASAPQAKAGVESGLALVKVLLKGSALATLSLVVDEQAARIAGTLQTVGGSELAQAFGQLKGVDNELLAAYPASAPLVIATQLADKAVVAFYRKVMAFTAKGLQGVMPAAALGVSKAFAELLTGRFVIAAHRVPGADGFAFSGVYGVKDVKQARALMPKMMKAYDASRFKPLQKSGYRAQFNADAYKIGDVPVFTARQSLPKKKMSGAAAGFVEALSTMHGAFAKKRGYFCYGKDAKATLAALLGGKLGGLEQAAGIKRAMSSCAPRPFFLLYLDAPAAVAGLTGGAPAKGAKGAGLGLTACAADKTLRWSLEVPHAQLAALRKAVAAFSAKLKAAR